MNALSGHQLKAVARLVNRELGLHFPPDKWEQLGKAIATASHIAGYSAPQPFLDHLLNRQVSFADLELLAGQLTIGETYFFREPDSFQALREHILPELIRQRRGRHQQIRIWSAGCSSGEEPFSIAITLRQLLPDWHDWNITVLATDINPSALQRGRQARYRPWSFRGLPTEMRQRYFQPVDQNLYELDPRFQAMVQFQHLNLAKDPYPSLVNHTSHLDLIMCRNVLMYFDHHQIADIVRRFAECLVPNGWLLVSSCETGFVTHPHLQLVSFPGITFHRKSDAARLFPEGAHAVPLPSELLAWPVRDDPEREPAPSVAPSDAVQPPLAPATPTPSLEAIEQLANSGDLHAARALADSWTARFKLHPRYHFLRGNILYELGEFDAALQAYRRVLYLQQDHLLARYAMASLARQLGHPSLAQREFRNCLASLHQLPPDQLLADSDGLTVERLAEIIKASSDVKLRNE